MNRRVAALIVAAGRGSRAGGGDPKQFRLLGGVPMLVHTLRLFNRSDVATLLCVIHPDDEARVGALLAEHHLSCLLAPGGDTRQASVKAGLECLAALPEPPTQVMVHDAARPFMPGVLIDRALQALQTAAAAIPVIPVVDTIKVCDTDGAVVATPERAGLFAVQTPQAFDFTALLAAHRLALTASATDDATLMEAAGHRVTTFAGAAENIKMTTAADFARHDRPSSPLRIGQGYDVHAFGAGDTVMLGGHAIAHTRGIDAHSDGDVLLHALTDALLGAIGAGDIGQHFPPSDPRWRGAPSAVFVRHAMSLLAERGGRVVNADLSLVAEEPRIGPHRAAIIASIASLLGLKADRVGLKATTNEKMGFLGRGEGLAALATVLVEFER